MQHKIHNDDGRMTAKQIIAALKQGKKVITNDDVAYYLKNGVLYYEKQAALTLGMTAEVLSRGSVKIVNQPHTDMMMKTTAQSSVTEKRE
ncbi:MAG: hypothetical protein M1491_07380 [Deltaproteobacteria bacterium]|nr:hypothetical protein [Deltaproteobacteria bacterium]MCL5277671.1 hypothetical protein [Deltaproteobacteria bacterium]